jgi:hypothetical protein
MLRREGDAFGIGGAARQDQLYALSIVPHVEGDASCPVTASRWNLDIGAGNPDKALHTLVGGGRALSEEAHGASI